MSARALIAAIAVAVALIPFSVSAEEPPSDEEMRDELERQISELELSPLEEYFDSIASVTGDGLASAEEIVLKYAEADPDAPAGIWRTAMLLIKSEAGGAIGAITVLAGAAMLTALAGSVTDKGVRPALRLALCGTAVTLTAGAFASLCRTAADAVGKASDITQKAAPVMSALLISIGAPSSAGVFRPLMAFLADTVIALIEKAALPIVLAGGALSAADALTDGKKIGELVKLSQKAVKWILGLTSAFYAAVTAVSGLTVASRDGVSIRTAKYAVDRIVPVVGSMVSGTVDSVMGCALMVKNGVGTAALLIAAAALARPLIVIGAGVFIFRTAAALSQPTADPCVTRLFSNTADMASYLFACAAAAGSMLAVTIIVFIASGGMTAGLW